jgi:hypothetical protein
VRAALENAGLRMTGLGGRSGGDGTFSNFRTKNLETVPSVPEIPRNPQRLKPRSSEGASRGAEAPLFHGISGGRACTLQDEIKGSGQECPLHTSRADAARVNLCPSRAPDLRH